MGRLSTHVLDTANGVPAQGMAIELSRFENGQWVRLKMVHTDADGRTDGWHAWDGYAITVSSSW